MAERFHVSYDGMSEYFKEKSKANNTRRSTNTWINVYNSWAEARGFSRNIYDYQPKELDEILDKFYLEIRKKDGKNMNHNV